MFCFRCIDFFSFLSLTRNSFLVSINTCKILLRSIIFISNFFFLVECSLPRLSSGFFSMDSFRNNIDFILNGVLSIF